MNGYRQRTEKKKEAIRKSAFDLFCEYGLEKVSLAEVAAKANVSPVTIYNYFGSKELLIRAVVEHYVREIWRDRSELFNSGQPYPEIIKQLIIRTGQFVSVMHVDFLNALTENDSDLRQLLMDINEEHMPLFIGFLEQGKQQGYIHPHISIDSVLTYFQILGETRIGRIFHESGDNSKLAADLTELIFYGLLSRKD